MAEPVDVSKKHFYISLVKSAVRIVAGGAFIVGGPPFLLTHHSRMRVPGGQ